MRHMRHRSVHGCMVRRLPSGAVEIERNLTHPLGPAAQRYLRRLCGTGAVIGTELVRTYASADRIDGVCRVIDSVVSQRGPVHPVTVPVEQAAPWEPTPQLLRAALAAVEGRPGLSFDDLAAELQIDLDQAHTLAERLISVGLIANEKRQA